MCIMFCQKVGRIVLLRGAQRGILTYYYAVRSLASSSSEQPTVEKLRAIFREYKQNNFPQELPSRVWKSILKTADEDGDDYISIDEAEHILENVEAADKVTREEIAQALKELGAEGDRIPVQVLKDLMSDQRGM